MLGRPGKRICYLVVSHGHFVSDISNLFVAEKAVYQHNSSLRYSDLLTSKRKEIMRNMQQLYFRMPNYCAISGYTVDKQDGGLDKFSHVFDFNTKAWLK